MYKTPREEFGEVKHKRAVAKSYLTLLTAVSLSEGAAPTRELYPSFKVTLQTEVNKQLEIRLQSQICFTPAFPFALEFVDTAVVCDNNILGSCQQLLFSSTQL